MAKKTKSTVESGESTSIFGLINSFDKSTEMIEDSKYAKIDEWISTGSYILNACISGSLFGGVPNKRSITFSGMPGTGKSYLALSVARCAQTMGYTPIYCDSEGAIDIETVKRIGCDTKNFMIRPVNTIEEFSNFAANLVKSIEATIEKGQIPPKVALFLDSLGNLTSAKEKEDIIDGKNVRDMGKQQKIRAMFRVIGNDLARLGVPFILTSHVYAAVGSYVPMNVVSGGGGVLFNSSVIIELFTSKLDDKQSEDKAKQANAEVTKVGVLVTAKPTKQRFAKPIKVQFQIPFFKRPNPYVGLEKFVNWTDCGILRGKALTEKEYLKLNDKEQKMCAEFEGPNGTILYAYPKDTARTLVCRHLQGEIPINELFTSKVFTDEVLHIMDEKIIRPTFELPSIDSMDDIEEMLGVDEDNEESINDDISNISDIIGE